MSVDAPDDRTVVFRFKQPYAPLLLQLDVTEAPIVPRHVYQGSDPQTNPANARPIGTGPFALTEASQGRVVLDANPTYWGGAPRSTRLVFVDTGDDARGEAMLDTQSADVVLLSTAPARPSGALSVPSWRIGYVALNTEKEPFKLVKVRRAVAAALDPALIAPAVSPIGVPLLSFLPLGVWGRRDGPPVLEASSANAKRLG